MPSRAHSPCRVPNCPHFSPCPVHVELVRTDARRSSSTRGYGYRWRLYRDGFLSVPRLCACGCRQMVTVENGVVDHIVPVSGPDDPLFWEPTNHQAMVRGHHSKKTASSDGGFGNKRRGGG
jgi:5-methylcytosine-specific restriction protein A